MLFAQLLFYLIYWHDLAPLALYDIHIEVFSLCHIYETVAEVTMRNDEEIVSRFCVIGNGHFHGKAAAACDHKSLSAAIHQRLEVGRSGHVLGGVWFQFSVQGKKVLYTGDMTLQPSSLAVDLPEPCDAAIMNCAYAGQCISQEKQYQKLLELIETTVCAGGKVLLPLPPKGRGSDVLKLVSAHGFGVPVFVEEQIVTCYQELQKKSLWLSQADEQGTCAANLTIVKNENERQQALNTAGGAVYLASDGMLTAPDGLVYYNALKADVNSLIIITGHAAAGTVGAGLFDEEYRRKNDVSVRAEKIICKVHLDEQDALSLQERLGFKKVILFHAIKEKNKSLLESFKERNIEALASSLPQTITL